MTDHRSIEIFVGAAGGLGRWAFSCGLGGAAGGIVASNMGGGGGARLSVDAWSLPGGR